MFNYLSSISKQSDSHERHWTVWIRCFCPFYLILFLLVRHLHANLWELSTLLYKWVIANWTLVLIFFYLFVSFFFFFSKMLVWKCGLLSIRTCLTCICPSINQYVDIKWMMTFTNVNVDSKLELFKQTLLPPRHTQTNGIYPSDLHPQAMNETEAHTFLGEVRQLIQKKENWIQISITLLKNWLCVTLSPWGTRRGNNHANINGKGMNPSVLPRSSRKTLKVTGVL